MLQFRVSHSMDEIKDEECEVDCWVIPRRNFGQGCTLRYALYRLLVQGLRRCQGTFPLAPPANVPTSRYRELCSGVPVWAGSNGQLQYEHPDGYTREFDQDGVFYRAQGQAPVVDDNGEKVWDTAPLWGS